MGNNGNEQDIPNPFLSKKKEGNITTTGSTPTVDIPNPFLSKKQPQIPQNEDSFFTNFGEGFEQGGKGLVAGVKYAVADIGERFTEDDLWSQEMKNWSKDYVASAPAPDDSVGQFLGSLVPSTVPSLAAVGSVFLSSGATAPAVAGYLAAGGLGLASAGQGMMDYDAYKESIGQVGTPQGRAAVGTAYMVAEFAMEKLALGHFSATAGKALLRGNVQVAEEAGKQMITKYAKQSKGDLVKLLKNIGGGSLVEGGQESLTELAQAITENLYRESEDTYGLGEIATRMKDAAIGGAIMGVGLGGVSYKAQDVVNNRRRDDQGFVRIGKFNNEGVEVIGMDKDNKMQIMYPDGNTNLVDPNTVTETVDVTPDQFRNILKGKTDETNAVERSRIEFQNQKKQQFDAQFEGAYSPGFKQAEDGNTILTLATIGEAEMVVVDETADGQSVYVTSPDTGGTPRLIAKKDFDNIQTATVDQWKAVMAPELQTIPDASLPAPVVGEELDYSEGPARVISFDPETGDSTIEYQKTLQNGDIETVPVSPIPRAELDTYRKFNHKAPELAANEAKIQAEQYDENGTPVEPERKVIPKAIEPIELDLEDQDEPITANGVEEGVYEVMGKKKSEATKLMKSIIEEYPNLAVELVDKTDKNNPTAKANYVIQIKTKKNDTKSTDRDIPSKQEGNTDTKKDKGVSGAKEIPVSKGDTGVVPTSDIQAQIGGEVVPSGQGKLVDITEAKRGKTGDENVVAKPVESGSEQIVSSRPEKEVTLEKKGDELVQTTPTESGERVQVGDKRRSDNVANEKDNNQKSTADDRTGDSVTNAKNRDTRQVSDDTKKETVEEKAYNRDDKSTDRKYVNTSEKVQSPTNDAGLRSNDRKTTRELSSNDGSKRGDNAKSVSKSDSAKPRHYNQLTKDEQASVRKIVNDYVSERNDRSDLSHKERILNEYGPSTRAKDFIKVNDKNNVTQSIAKSYFKKDAMGLDQQAKEINDQFFDGEDVMQPSDIADFMVRFPNGPDKVGNKARELNQQYQAITGKSLNIRTAKALAQKFGVTEEVVNEAENGIESMEFLLPNGETDWVSLHEAIKSDPEVFKKLGITSFEEQNHLSSLAQEYAENPENIDTSPIGQDRSATDTQAVSEELPPFQKVIEETKALEPRLENTDETNIASAYVNPFGPKNQPIVEKEVAKFRKKYPNAPEIVVLESHLDLQLAFPKTPFEELYSRNAFYNPNDGKAYIVASAPRFKSATMVEGSLLHEVVGHFGVRKALDYAGKDGNKKFNDFMGDVFEKYKSDPFLQKVYDNYKNEQQIGNTPFEELSDSQKVFIAEEYVAHVSETNTNKTLVQEIVDFFRELLGLDPDMSNDMVRDIIANGRRLVEVGDNMVSREPLLPSNNLFQMQPAPEITSFTRGGSLFVSALAPDGDIIGTAMFASDGEVMAVDVEPEYQRQGVATYLYRHARSKGVDIRPGQIQTEDAKRFWEGARFQKETTIFENYENESRDSQIRGGALQKAARDNFKNAYDYIGRGVSSVEANEQIAKQHQNAKEYAKANGLWLNSLADLGVETDFGGMENKIAVNTDKGEIYKSNNLFVYKGNILDYINYIQRHNFLSPITGYELAGFHEVMKNGQPWIKPVVKQTFLRGDGIRQATQDEIDAKMKERGYYSNNRKSYSYDNGTFEISDLKPANVLFKDGEIFIVDNITKKFKAEDVRFQMSKPIEQAGDLIALHNLSVRGLLNANKVGGLAMPSLAITKRDLQFDKFGEISLIADKSMVDPKVRGNRTFGADVYSPRYPSVTYFADEKQIKDRFGKYTELMPKDYKSTISEMLQRMEDRGVESAKNSDVVKVAYLTEQGKKLPVLKEEPKPYVLPSLLNHVKAKKAEGYYDFLEARKDDKFKELYLKHRKEDLIKKGYDPEVSRLLKVTLEDFNDKPYLLDEGFREAEKALNPKVEYKTSEWFRELDQMIGEYGSPKRDKFGSWVEKEFENIDISEKLFKGYTYSGTKQWLPHNIENVMKMLQKDIRGGEGGSYGVGMARAAYTPQFKSIQDIRNAKDNIVDEETFNKVKEEIDKDFFEISDKLRRPSDNSFGHADRVIDLLVDARKNGLERELKEYGFTNVSESTKKEIYAFTEKLRNFPTEYFESKPNRIVDISEFRGAVVPSNTPKNVLDILSSKGIKVVKYDSSNNEDRQTKLNQFLDKKENKDIRFQKDPKDNFYSNSLHAIRNVNQGKATGDQWRAMLLKNGASQSELEWIGFDDFLKDNPKPSKDEVYEFINSNKIEVVDVVKGENDQYEVYEKSSGEVIDIFNDKEEAEAFASFDENREVRNAGDKRVNQETKYSQYQLPGGSNYKEIILTMPVKSTSIVDEMNQFARGNVFKSSHWDEPNILAHTRIHDMMVGNEKVLIVNDIQSDWAQDGRKKGFKGDENEQKVRARIKEIELLREDILNAFPQSKKYNEYRKYLTDKYSVDPNTNKNLTSEELIKLLDLESERNEIKQTEEFKVSGKEYKALGEELNELNKTSFSNIPNTPFPQTSQWLTLTIRRLIRYAAENGHNRIAFINGQQAADMFDLSKSIEKIGYTNDNYLSAWDKSGKKVIEQYATDKQLPDIIGKEAADKLISQAPDGMGGRSLRNQDLKVGGEGMKSFYDKILPSTASKLLKKLDKTASVENIDFGGETTDFMKELNDRGYEWEYEMGGDYMLVDKSGEPVDYDDLPDDIKVLADNTEPSSERSEPKNKSGVGQQQSFEITSLIRQKAIQEGLPMFQKEYTPVEHSDDQKGKWLDHQIYKFQDRQIYLKRLIEQKKAKGREITDQMDAYSRENRSTGIIQEQLNQFNEKYATNLDNTVIGLSKENGVAYDEITRYLKAKHIWTDKVENGGFDNLEGEKSIESAGKYVEEFEGKVSKKNVDQLLNDVKAINQYALEKQLEYGLKTKEEYDKLQSMHKFYVPLRGFEGMDEKDHTTRTKDYKRKGRVTESGDPIPHLLLQAQTAIMDGEQNRVKQALLNFVTQNPDGKNYRILSAWYLTDPKTGDVSVKYTTPTADEFEKYNATRTEPAPEGMTMEQYKEFKRQSIYEKDQITVKVDGKKVVIEFTNPLITAAFKKQGIDQLPKFLQWSHNAVAYLRKAYTQYSPEFGPRNLIRDMSTGLINVNNDYGINVAGKVFKNMKSATIAAKKGLLNRDFGGAEKLDKAEWMEKMKNPQSMSNGEMMRMFLEIGGLTGYSDMRDIASIRKDMQSKVDGMKDESKAISDMKKAGKVAFKYTLGALDRFNQVTENIMRFSTFKTMIEEGMSPEKAALYAKDVTVNFNRKGTFANAIGGLYLFWNASIQGNERLLRPFGILSPSEGDVKKRAIATALTLPALYLGLTMLNRIVGGDDDDGEPYYDKLTDYDKTHNLIIPTGVDGKFARIPLPYGYNVFFAWPANIMDAMSGKQDIGGSVLNTAALAMESFSPLGAPQFSGDLSMEGKAAQFISPTVFKAPLEVAFNNNFMGLPIFKEQSPYGTPRPDSEMHYGSVDPIMKAIASSINSATGGDKEESGFVDINPEVIEHYVGSYTGGLGKFLSNSIATLVNLAQHGSETFTTDKIKHVPFIRGYVTEPHSGIYRSAFFDQTREIEAKNDIYNRYKKAGNKQRAIEYKNENINYLRMANMVKSYKEKAGKLIDLQSRYENQGRTEEAQAIEKRLKELYLQFSERYKKTIDGKPGGLSEWLGL